MSNTVAPAFEGLEMGIGESLLVKAICEATGRSKQSVEEAYAAEGDLGSIAMSSRAHQKTLSFGAFRRLGCFCLFLACFCLPLPSSSLPYHAHTPNLLYLIFTKPT